MTDSDPRSADSADRRAARVAPCGDPHFHDRDGALHCEQVAIRALADAHGTPLFVYSRAAIVERFARLRAAFGDDARIAFAVKSNSNLHVLRLLADLGAGFDVVSLGELRRLEAARVDTRGVVFAGVAKQDDEVAAALRAGILMFNLESEHEVDVLDDVGRRLGMRVPVAVRINPDVDANTHAYISTGRKENKFGLDMSAAARVVARIRAAAWLDLLGYHVHLGSQLRTIEPYLAAFERVVEFVDGDPARGDGVRYYDLGGGFGVSYGDGSPPLDVAALGALLVPRIRARGWTAVLEPGRFLVADAGVLVTRVIGTKRGSARTFVLADAAMNDLLRPALYRAEHPIAPVTAPSPSAPRVVVDVVGPVCESSDFLALGRELPELSRGDLLAVFGAGAYGASMASNYNSRRRPAELLVDGARVRLIRRRERFEDLWAAELDT